jgi:hypothetical protein
MIKDYHEELLGLYNECYNDTLKPLLAAVESKYEQQPSALFNEIRSFNDHIARCYIPTATVGFIKENLDRARGHLKRAILDCFKHLNIYYHKSATKFERTCRYFDITAVNNGKFHIAYRELKQDAIKCVREAKKYETLNEEKAFAAYQDAYDKYVALDDLINDNCAHIMFARVKFSIKRGVKIVCWIAAAIFSGIISDAVGLFSRDAMEIVKAFWQMLTSWMG